MKTRPIMTLLLAVACALSAAAQTLSGIEPSRFDSIVDGRATHLYILKNKGGAEACITNFGARLVSLMMPDRRGRTDDVVLGFDNLRQYCTVKQNFGATVGRYAGRIAHGECVIDGDTVRFRKDGNGNLSHGGTPGFANRVWEVVRHRGNSITLRYVSPDGESGFPGQLTTTLTYTLTNGNELRLDYKARTTQTTVVNYTHHSFFCLSGDPRSDVLSETLQVEADSMAAIAADKNVTGRFAAVAGTPFDFRNPKAVGAEIDADDAQLKVTRGYDHAWQLRPSARNAAKRRMHKAAVRLCDPATGRTLTVSTTEPAAHIYTANGLKGNIRGKHSVPYPSRSAVCIETMHFSDSPNQPHFPSTLLRPGDTFRSTTVYRFGVDRE